MSLPESIQRNADQADELEKQIIGSAEAPGDEAPQAGEDTATAEEQTHTEEPSDDVEKLTAKYKTLQGMYNADVARAKAQNEELERKLAEYEQQVKQLRESIASTEESKTYLTEEDTEVFGEDMVDFAKRVARQEAAKYSVESARLRNEVDELKARLSQQEEASVATRREQFFSALSAEVPDWRTQNEDQGFLDWLNESDPFAGGARKAALDAAVSVLDVKRVADIFRAYNNAKQAQPQLSKAQRSLRKQVAPDTRSGATTAPGGEKRYFTQDEIRDFYEGVRRNQYTSEQAAAIEHEIDMAVAEGRIR